MRDITKAPFSTRVNLIFSSAVRLFCQIDCLPVYSTISYRNTTILETLKESLAGITLVVQMHKIIFTPVSLPAGSRFEVIFAHIFALLLFLYSSVS